MKIRHVFALAALTVVGGAGTGLAGCSSDDVTAQAPTSTRISAATGGTVTDGAGTVSLEIPAGALAADTDISLAVAGKTDQTVSSVYDFGPNGLTFLKPVTLKIKGTKPDGKDVAIAYEDNGTWKPLTDTSVGTDGFVKATTTHFTKYAIVIVNGDLVVQAPKTCEDAQAQFSACGGDPKGTWKFGEFCVPSGVLAADPFDGKCPEATMTFEITSTRLVTIDATTIKTSAGTETVASELTIPNTCLTANSATCEQVANGNEGATCAGNATACVCNGSEVTEKTESTATYTTSGNTISITDSDGKVSTGEYCVKGSLLYFKGADEAGKTELIYVLEKQ